MSWHVYTQKQISAFTGQGQNLNHVQLLTIRIALQHMDFSPKIKIIIESKTCLMQINYNSVIIISYKVKWYCNINYFLQQVDYTLPL